MTAPDRDPNTQDKQKGLHKRNPFTRPQGDKKHVHSPDLDRDEIAPGVPDEDLVNRNEGEKTKVKPARGPLH